MFGQIFRFHYNGCHCEKKHDMKNMEKNEEHD
jgi:hypothetical protein